MNVWMIGSEMAPYSKVGGLGDVLGALPNALAHLGCNVTVIIPHLPDMDPVRWGIRSTGVEFDVRTGYTATRAQVLEASLPTGVRVLFILCPHYFHREGLYGTSHGEYVDNAQRFAFFSRAAIEAGQRLAPDPDVVHTHDWPSALVPFLLRAPEHYGPLFPKTVTVQTIHNLSHQGVFHKELLPELGIGWQHFHYLDLEFYDQINYLKSGLTWADVVTTVSPTYAREIQGPEHGWGLEGVIRGRGEAVHGILNGIDTDVWDPARDLRLPARYAPGAAATRARNTHALRDKVGLPKDGRPLVGMATRLVFQKGLDLMLELWDGMADLGVQWVILGTGEHRFERALSELAARHPESIAVTIGFDEAFSRLIYAGSDFFAMPSLFEPCGLGQLIALRYGSLPIVRRTGGLADTVVDVSEKEGVGIVFDEATPAALAWAVRRAAELHADRKRFAAARRRGMALDYSWDASAARYIEIFREERAKKGA